jgi:hypothetical protein
MPKVRSQDVARGYRTRALWPRKAGLRVQLVPAGGSDRIGALSSFRRPRFSNIRADPILITSPHAQRPSAGNHCVRDHGGLDDRRTLAFLNLDGRAPPGFHEGSLAFFRRDFIGQPS